ncbi:hypothetical protein JCM19379_19840 [Methyloparacoccus murrellii]
MKVSLLIPCLLTGGTEVATLTTARALRDLGHAVEVVVYFDEVAPAMLDTFAAAGIAVKRLDVTRGGGLVGAWRLARGLARALTGRPDLIWLQYMTPTLAPLLVARLCTGRLIACVHVAAGHYRAGGQWRLRWLARWVCTRVVCVSHTTARGLFGLPVKGGYLGGRVRVLPNAIDLAAVQLAPRRDWRRELDLPPTARLVGFVGRLAHVKGVDVLLRAAASLTADRPDVHWVVVGDGSERAELESLAEALGLSAAVHFVGAVAREDIYSAIKGFDIGVMPSRPGLEGFGLSALEAMACGVPLVASAVDALPEVVLDGETGILAPPGEPVALAAALRKLLDDPALADRLRDRALRHVAGNYGLAAYRARLAEVLRT